MKKIPVILDTDIGPDCDDTAALAILNHFCDEALCELLAVTHCTGSLYGVPTISAINHAFSRRVPIGTCKNPNFLSSGSALRYTPHVAKAFPNDYPEGAEQQDARTVFRAALENAEEGSVLVIAIGPLNNLAEFLKDAQCGRLIAEKVKGLVTMAGYFAGAQNFAEWNVEQDIPAARYVAENWPGPIVYCPFETGEKILTGASLSEYSKNPVALSYRLYTNGGMLRPSWDLITVMAAICKDGALLPLSEPGRISINEKGETRFAPTPEGQHRYLLPTDQPDALTEWVENLLSKSAARMERT